MRLKETSSSRSLSKQLVVIVLAGVILLALGSLVLKLKNKPSASKKNPTSANAASTSPIASFQRHELLIDLKKEAYGQLKRKRNEALKRGLLFTSKDDLVDANLKIDGQAYGCKLRLKGDLLDHLQGDRWSFRIILKGNEEWDDMNTFSVHNSKARSHTAEWVMHEVFREEGIIAPAYDFIKVQLNGKDLGVYAYEQHFENQLLEKNGRTVGPILKHNDDAYWENVQADINPFPWVDASHLELFNKTNNTDPAFLEAYEMGRDMLNGFLQEKLSAAEVFDLELLAKYYALLDISHAWHAQQFTNIRFYFNSHKGKLEPIAYDCFGDYLHDVTKDWEAFGEAYNTRVSKYDMFQRGNVYRYMLFKDRDFYEKYMWYLKKYTDPSHLQSMIKKYKVPLDNRARLIRSDAAYKDYKLDWDKFYAKANFTYRKLEPKPRLSLKVYQRNDSDNKIALESFHGFPLEILGYGDEVSLINPINEPLMMEGYNLKIPVRKYTLDHNQAIDYVYYRTLGLKAVHKTKVINDNAFESIPQLVDGNSLNLNGLPFVNSIGKQLVISSGTYNLNQPLVIPPDYSLEIAAGTVIRFGKQGSILCYGTIKAIGTPQNPIQFIADGSNQGLMISEQKESSKFSYCHFDGLSGYRWKNIHSPSAVTIYESKVDFSFCRFQNITAQEALRSQYSTINLNDSDFKNCQGSALLSKNARLHLSQINFNNIGRDGLIVESGSMEGLGITLDSVLNRALVLKENCKIYMVNAGIEDSHQGVYASEHAKVNIRQLWLTNLTNGIEVRGKNVPLTEVEIGKLHTKEIDQLYLLKKGISITVDGKKQNAQ